LLLVVDNGSVFTKNLTEFLKKIKLDFTIISHEKMNSLDLSIYSSIILSGRRKNDKKMNAINSKLIKHAISEKKPLLGICYGAEILALSLGGTIKATSSPCRGPEKVKVTKQNPLCQEQINVFESHSYEISSLQPTFEVLGQSPNCLREIIQYGNMNIFGVQFHPEMTEDGQELIRKFTNL